MDFLHFHSLLPTPNAAEGTNWTRTYNPDSQMGRGLTALAVNGLLLSPMSKDGFSRRSDHAGTEEPQPAKSEFGRTDCPQGWWRNFPTVAAVCDGDDGLSSGIPGLTLPFRGWRKNAIAALGNSMVPQVVMELFRAIEVEFKDMQR